MPALVSVCMTAPESVIVALQTPPEGPQHSLLLSILGLILEVHSQVFLDFFSFICASPTQRVIFWQTVMLAIESCAGTYLKGGLISMSLWVIGAGGL